MREHRPKINILCAYPYFDRQIVAELQNFPRGSINLIVDSGAFTAWNSGKPICLDDYCKFLDSISVLQPFTAVQLDVAYDPIGTFQNLTVMKRRGYNVAPVFQRGDQIETLDELYYFGDYVFLGGAGRGTKKFEFLEWVLSHNKNRKMHWLAACHETMVQKYQPFSVDSSTWLSGAIFGRVNILNEHKAIVTFGRDEIKKKLQEQYKNIVRLGFNENEIPFFLDPRSYRHTGQLVDLENLHNDPQGFAKFISTLTFMARAFEWQRAYGTKYFFAITAKCDLLFLKKAYNFLHERNSIYVK